MCFIVLLFMQWISVFRHVEAYYFVLEIFCLQDKKMCLCPMCILPVKKGNLTWSCRLYHIYIYDFHNYFGITRVQSLYKRIKLYLFPPKGMNKF